MIRYNYLFTYKDAKFNLRCKILKLEKMGGVGGKANDASIELLKR